ncbi:hypothetical protein HDU76_002955 [Blyttiomyces sp. JEL0837]|nr:hypothetical protein HDU76_002955 [Blyttiomyces sp. JEL0837]
MQFGKLFISIIASAVAATALPQSAVDISTLPATCFNPVPHTCDFYFNCLDVAYPCGPDGYAQGYGGKFCRAFQKNANTLSDKAQQWMWSVMTCLQTSLVPKLGQEMTCQAIHDFAFSTHTACYTQTGNSICDLSPFDWYKILNTIGFATLIQTDTLTFEAKIAGICAKHLVGAK